MPCRYGSNAGEPSPRSSSRPEARNAVDGPTAAELADAFRAFEADDEARAAVLWGEEARSARAPT